jgi:hypothetical protein
MKRFVSSHLSPQLQIVCITALLLTAASCGGTPTGTSGGGCQVITGNTTTTFSAAGGSASVSIRAAANCTWGAVSNAAFLTVTQGAAGAGDGAVQFKVDANTGSQRSAALTITDSEPTIADTVIAITQNAP